MPSRSDERKAIMLLRANARKRTGTTAVEAAVILPILFTLVFAMAIGASAVFMQQEVAHAARATARYASVHGGQYATQNASAISANTLPTVDKAYLTSYAKGQVFTLDTTQLQVSVNMTVLTPGATAATSTETVDWDSTTENQNRSPYSNWTDSSTTPATNKQVSNTVTVTVSYAWSPPLFFGLATYNLTSTVVVGMSY